MKLIKVCMKKPKQLKAFFKKNYKMNLIKKGKYN